MTRVMVERGSGGKIVAFSVEGHTGFAKHGSDIVCAAVSVLAQTAVLGLTQVLGAAASVRQEDGFLACRLLAEMKPEDRRGADLILETMLAGLKDISGQYPRHVVLLEKNE